MRSENTFKPMTDNMDINARIAELEAALKARDKVLATLIHDVKGPVHSLYVFLDEQKELLEKEDYTFLLDEAVRKLKPLDTMLADVFDWAAHSMKEPTIHCLKPANLFQLVTDSLEALSCQAHEKQISLFTDVAKDMQMSCDSQTLQIVLRNLLTNAIKFSTSNGKIWVQAGIHEHTLELSVIDEGIGMKETTIKNLFSDADVKTIGTKGEKGTGMGLIFCRQLLESIGGHLEIENVYGNGTRCTVFLPVTE